MGDMNDYRILENCWDESYSFDWFCGCCNSGFWLELTGGLVPMNYWDFYLLMIIVSSCR